jgi:multiple sugar transport system substrate-binding protein
MAEVELTVMSRNEQADRFLVDSLKAVEAAQRVTVHIRFLNWASAWGELVRVGIYGRGADVSEIGSTWIRDFSAMNALRPFSTADLAAMGTTPRFLNAALQTAQSSGTTGGDGSYQAVPFLTDARLVYFRRDLLAKAGVDEAGAFSDAARFEDTLAWLADVAAMPLAIPTLNSRMMLHELASWIWGAGGDFLSADGHRVLFHEPPALSGLRAYYRLGRFLSAEARRLGENESDAAFLTGRAAVTISGPWLLRLPDLTPQVRENLGVAVPLGVSFLGGSHLAQWRDTRHARPGLACVHHLVSPGFQAQFAWLAGMLPARLDVLHESPFSGDASYRAIEAGLAGGRSFPDTPLWGSMEDQLVDACARIWSEVLADSPGDLDAILQRHIMPLARRLSISLSN